jgi:hypothetical protein
MLDAVEETPGGALEPGESQRGGEPRKGVAKQMKTQIYES